MIFLAPQITIGNSSHLGNLFLVVSLMVVPYKEPSDQASFFFLCVCVSVCVCVFVCVWGLVFFEGTLLSTNMEPD